MLMKAYENKIRPIEIRHLWSSFNSLPLQTAELNVSLLFFLIKFSKNLVILTVVVHFLVKNLNLKPQISS